MTLFRVLSANRALCKAPRPLVVPPPTRGKHNRVLYSYLPFRIPPIKPKPRKTPRQHPKEHWVGIVARPLEDFSQTIARRYPGVADPREVHRIYCAFLEDAQRNQDSPLAEQWERQFLQKHNITASFLFEVGTIATGFISPPPSRREYAMAIRILDAAGAMGHEPSTLELGLLLLQPSHRDAFRAFIPRVAGRIAPLARREKPNPNALVVYGDLFIDKDQPDDALREWRRALRIGLKRREARLKAAGLSPEAEDALAADFNHGASFEWEVICRLRIASVMKSRGKLAEAREVLEPVVGSQAVEVLYELAALDTTHPQANLWLTQAAMSGHVEATALLAQVVLDAQKEASEKGGKQGKKDAQRLFADALEWTNLVTAQNEKEPDELSVF